GDGLGRRDPLLGVESRPDTEHPGPQLLRRRFAPHAHLRVDGPAHPAASTTSTVSERKGWNAWPSVLSMTRSASFMRSRTFTAPLSKTSPWRSCWMSALYSGRLENRVNRAWSR